MQLNLVDLLSRIGLQHSRAEENGDECARALKESEDECADAMAAYRGQPAGAGRLGRK